MLGFAIASALVLALAAAARRRWKRARIELVAASLPGASPSNPISLDDPREIDAALRSRRCICGGLLSNRGERSERHELRVLRVVRSECNRCEREQSVYFDLSMTVH